MSLSRPRAVKFAVVIYLLRLSSYILFPLPNLGRDSLDNSVREGETPRLD
jgi:hypothetical protein